jgi:hypothetical protein
MAVYGPGCHPQNSIWTEALSFGGSNLKQAAMIILRIRNGLTLDNSETVRQYWAQDTEQRLRKMSNKDPT